MEIKAEAAASLSHCRMYIPPFWNSAACRFRKKRTVRICFRPAMENLCPGSMFTVNIPLLQPGRGHAIHYRWDLEIYLVHCQRKGTAFLSGKDPQELHDLSKDPDSQEILERYREILIEELSRRPQDGLVENGKLKPGCLPAFRPCHQGCYGEIQNR